MLNHYIQIINSNIYISGQLLPEQIQIISNTELASFLCLRCTYESGFSSHERLQVESLGIRYSHIPLSPHTLNSELITRTLQMLDILPKPVLISCRTAFRAGFIALLYLSTRHQLSKREIHILQKNFGFDFNTRPPFQKWFDHYLNEENTAISACISSRDSGARSISESY